MYLMASDGDTSSIWWWFTVVFAFTTVVSVFITSAYRKVARNALATARQMNRTYVILVADVLDRMGGDLRATSQFEQRTLIEACDKWLEDRGDSPVSGSDGRLYLLPEFISLLAEIRSDPTRRPTPAERDEAAEQMIRSAVYGEGSSNA